MYVVIPFREEGKSRLPEELRREVGLAMLGDVVEAAISVGDVRVVTADPAGRLVAGELGAEIVDDPGEGQGVAVAAALADVDGICLVVNADLPRVRPSDLAALSVSPRLGRVALVASADGRTNALGLPYAEVFRPLYGPDGFHPALEGSYVAAAVLLGRLRGVDPRQLPGSIPGSTLDEPRVRALQRAAAAALARNPARP